MFKFTSYYIQQLSISVVRISGEAMGICAKLMKNLGVTSPQPPSHAYTRSTARTKLWIAVKILQNVQI